MSVYYGALELKASYQRNVKLSLLAAVFLIGLILWSVSLITQDLSQVFALPPLAQRLVFWHVAPGRRELEPTGGF